MARRQIQFSYASHGKPELVTSTSQAQPLNFNLAHSGGFALYAFTRVGEIGVDLEHIRPDFTGDDIARRFFSSNEVGHLAGLPANVRHEAFFNCRRKGLLLPFGTRLVSLQDLGGSREKRVALVQTTSSSLPST